MPQFIECPDMCEVVLVYARNSQIIQNVFHFKKVGFVSTDLLDLAADIKSWYNVTLKGTVPSDTSLTEIIVTDLNTQSSPSYVYTTGLPIAGTLGAGSFLPNNVTIAVKHNTVNRGRNYRGRTFHPGLTTSQLAADANHITGAAQTALNTAYSALMTDANFHNFVWSVLSRYLNKSARPAGVGTTVNSVSTNLAADSMRRRLPERGR